MDYNDYKKQKALEEVVRKLVQKVKESELKCELFHGGWYEKSKI